MSPGSQPSANKTPSSNVNIIKDGTISVNQKGKIGLLYIQELSHCHDVFFLFNTINNIRSRIHIIYIIATKWSIILHFQWLHLRKSGQYVAVMTNYKVEPYCIRRVYQLKLSAHSSY